ncbi:hypothetical protein J3458_022105 [Metarhizium acridum]|uniref:uncharacterized protein n=1 Tax=Metarhizium acridum TaxID=92637 RepID=UPI001C6C0847|nr:hypothetical protein J3458_022105 [Metarhizium acridum]
MYCCKRLCSIASSTSGRCRDQLRFAQTLGPGSTLNCSCPRRDIWTVAPKNRTGDHSRSSPGERNERNTAPVFDGKLPFRPGVPADEQVLIMWGTKMYLSVGQVLALLEAVVGAQRVTAVHGRPSPTKRFRAFGIFVGYSVSHVVNWYVVRLSQCSVDYSQRGRP